MGGNDERDFQLAYQLSGFREILHYLLLPVRFKFLYPDGSGGPRFLWRLVLLLAIGYLHGLIVRVDILLIYAILGFVLVLMYKWPTKLLAGITLFLFLGGGDTCPGSL